MTLKPLSILAVLVATVIPTTAKAAGIQGAWKVTEVTTTGNGGRTNTSPQPSLFLFTRKHFSMLAVNGDNPRPNTPADPSKASAAELFAAWGPFTAVSGTYQVSGGTLTTHPSVSKNPRNMVPGAEATYTMKMERKTLILVNVTGPGGAATNPTAMKLTRVE
jgi:hypothetical protein